MTMPPSASSPCPCCGTVQIQLQAPAYTRCACCGHRWRLPLQNETAGYYEALVARNDVQTPWFRRKIAERVSALVALLGPQVQRVLEIGCAEGDLGAAIKARTSVNYDGIELSRDSESAERKLDRVFRTPASQVRTSVYDLIVSFHVLEHIAHPELELASWSGLLAADGQLLIEVPNQAGHPLLADDRNPEHLHQFTPASLSTLLSRCGFACQHLSTGHYESPVYPDSIRAIARPELTASQRRDQLLRRFRDSIHGPFIVYGIGGDYLNYLAPLAEALEIRALLDSSPGKWGQRVGPHIVTGYDPSEHDAFPILVCSIRFGAQIKQHLLALGIEAQRIIGLDSIYECP